MANYNSTRYTQQLGTSQSAPAVNYPAPTAFGGKLRIAEIPYTLTAAEAANDTIKLCKLKPGAVIVRELSFVRREDPGTTLTLNIGDSAVADRYSKALDIGAAGSTSFASSGSAPGALFASYVVTEATSEIIVTVATAASLTANAKLLFLVAYLDE